MVPALREKFNAGFTQQKYKEFQEEFSILFNNIACAVCYNESGHHTVYAAYQYIPVIQFLYAAYTFIPHGIMVEIDLLPQHFSLGVQSL